MSEDMNSGLSDADKIRDARLRRNWSQEDLASQLHSNGYRAPLSQAAISNFETGYRPVPFALRHHLEDVLGITLPLRPVTRKPRRPR